MLSRRQLYGMGITRWELRGQLKAWRWQRVGEQSVCLHNGPIDQTAHWWAAVFQGGPRACLDGVTALQASGLQRYQESRIRVSVPRGAKVRRSRHYDIRQTRRWDEADLAAGGIPRTRPEVAAVRGALWAKTDKQATHLLTVTVQQGISPPDAIGRELLRVRRHKRRLLLTDVVNDLLDGARSLGEIDFGRELRRRGLPEPQRQVLRRGKDRRYYLDLYWPDYKLVVEIDGIHHSWVENVVGDALRQNALVLDDDKVLRVPLLGFRLCPDEFLDQIEEALAAGGWPRRDVITSEHPLAQR